MSGYPPSIKNDAEWIATFGKIHDPLEALKLIIENESFFGFDPYYRDIRDAVLGVGERVLKEHGIEVD